MKYCLDIRALIGVLGLKALNAPKLKLAHHFSAKQSLRSALSGKRWERLLLNLLDLPALLLTSSALLLFLAIAPHNNLPHG
jgi:hypothetical protein